MSERASQEITIAAPVAKVLEAVLELDEYTLWIPEITDVKVFDRDSRGRASRAQITSMAMGKTIVHTYAYSYEKYPDEISWVAEEGTMINSLTGIYRVVSYTNAETILRYELDIDLSSPLPGFLKKQAAQKIVSAALDNLKKWCEKPPPIYIS